MTIFANARSGRQGDHSRRYRDASISTLARTLAATSTAMIVLATGGQAVAQTWNGSADNDWTNGANWSSGGAPSGAAGVTINLTSPIVLGVNGAASGFTNGLILNGNLTVQSGSTLNSAGAGLLASPSTRTATMSVTGEGSQWIVNGTLAVGSAGIGTLNISDGALVKALNGVRVGSQATSRGILNITNGTLETTGLEKGTGAARVNFDNAILRAAASDPAFVDTLTASELVIAAGGLTVDTNGFAIGAPGFSGTGSLTTTGTGTLTLNDVSTYTGDTIVGSGSTLALSGAGAIASSRLVADGTFDVSGMAAAGITISRLEGLGTVVLGGKTLTVSQIAPGGNAIGTLTLDGDYAGTGATLNIQSTLAGDGATSDLLIITGNYSGNTNVAVTKSGGTSAMTVNGIKVVDIGGSSLGTFTLLGDVVVNGEQAVAAGAYLYGLYQGTPGSADGDWYLRTLSDPSDPDAPLVQPAAPVVEAYVAAALQSLNTMESMQQRLGGRWWVDKSNDGGGLWGRVEGEHTVDVPGASTTGAGYTVDTIRLQVGLDAVARQWDGGKLIGSGNLQLGGISASIGSTSGSGTVSGAAVGLGGGVTWLADSGLYLDAQGKLNWFDTSLYSTTLGRSIVSGNDGFGYALGLEAGQRFAIDDTWSVGPQAQLSYSHVSFTDFLDPFGNTVSLDRSDSLVGRLGLSADYKSDWQDTAGRAGSTHLYGLANVTYEFLDGTSTLIGGDSVASKSDPLWGSVGIGGSLNWLDDKLSLFGEANVASSLNNFGESYGLGVTTGLTGKF